MGGVKDKIISVFKTSIATGFSKRTRVNNVYGGGKKNTRKSKIIQQSEYNIIKDVKNYFWLKQKKENESIEDRIIRDIRKLFEQELDYYKPGQVIFIVIKV